MCCLRLQTAIHGYSANLAVEGGTPLEARVGINVGEVVSTLTTDDTHAEYAPIGHTDGKFRFADASDRAVWFNRDNRADSPPGRGLLSA
jgi:hypothetical protein